MKNKNKVDLADLCMVIAPKFWSVAVFLCACFLIVGEIVFPDERDVIQTDCREFEAEWHRVLANGELEEAEVPGNVKAESGELVTLVTTLPQKIYNGENICFRPIWQDVSVYIDGKLRKTYCTKDSRPFGTNSAFRYVFVELNEEDAGKELIYQFSSASKYSGTIRKVYIGDRASIWFHLISEVGSKSAAALCLGIMGFFCIIICLILRWAFRKPLDLSYLAWAIFLCAIWMLSEVEFRQLLIKNVSVLTSSTYWSLMLIAFPLIRYINEIQKGHYKLLYAIALTYSMIVFVVGTILQAFDIVQFVTQLPFIHFGLAFSIISIIATITIDTFKKRIQNYLLVGIGIYGMLVSAVIEMLVYYMEVDISLGTVLAVGLMFLLVMAIIKTGQDLLASEKKKQEAIAAREAQAKFLANMSHEIRTPINAVIGMNEMILRENENETIQEYAQNVKSASKMLLELVNDILDFSKIESGQLELVEDSYRLSSVIHDEKLLLETRIGTKPIEVYIDADPMLPSGLYGDELRIKQILTNLLSNAAKYTEKGTITLKVFFQWINDDTISLCFLVKDTGVGIKEEDLPKLFEEFKRFDIDKNRNVEGTGLGLNIVKQLVYLMQGNISVNSEYGKGSAFTVFIPQKVVDKTPMGDFEQSVRRNRSELQTAENHFTAPDASILVVDDNTMNLTLMKALLKRTQIKVDTAASGMECLKLTRQKKYDMIMMDHMMPQMDGVETLHKLRAEQANLNKNAIVIALTANAIAGCRDMYMGYGFNDYFAKPIQTDKLDELLVQYLPKEVICMEENISPNVAEADATVSEENMETDRTIPEDAGAIENAMDNHKVSEELLAIDRESGLTYCMNMEEIYQQMLAEFCNQMEIYLPQLDECFAEENWGKYAVTVHAIKGNALNIGASNFSNLSLQHERAAKELNSEFIRNGYADYIAALKALVFKIKNTL